MGTPQDKRSLLPAEQAKDVLARFGDTNQSFDDRTNSVLGTVFSTSDKAQQQQIFEQLVRQDNSFAKFQSAFEAYGRGDVGAARRLFQAGMTDPEKLPYELSAQDKERMQERIGQAFLGPGEIGDAVYGFSANIVGNEERAVRDGALISDAIRYQLMSGNSPNLDAAIEAVKKDIYGPTSVLQRDNALLAVPNDVDQDAVYRGLMSMMPTIKASASTLAPAAPGDLSADQRGAWSVRHQMMSIATDDVIEQGEWRNVGDGFAFVDVASGTAFADASGRPIIVTIEEALSAGNQVPASPDPRLDIWQRSLGVSIN
jgi:hypothetical protein